MYSCRDVDFHFDHRGGVKVLNPSDAARWYIDVFLEELGGDCDPTCAFCHGEVTAWQNGVIGKPEWMN